MSPAFITVPSIITSDTVVQITNAPSTLTLGYNSAGTWVGTIGTAHINLSLDTSVPITYTVGYRTTPTAQWVFGVPTETSTLSHIVTFDALIEEGTQPQYYIQVSNQQGTTSSGILTIVKNLTPPAPPPPTPTPPPPAPTPPPSPVPAPTPSIAGNLPAESIVNAMTAGVQDIFIREKVDYSELVPLPDDIFINDPTDPEYSSTEYEWRSWDVPTQAEIDGDLPAPLNAWKPYVGPETIKIANADLIKAMKEDNSFITLPDGTRVQRYTSSWSDWTELKSNIIRKISNGSTAVSATFSEALEQTRLSVYQDGIQLNAAAFTILNNTVTLKNIIPEGSTITLLQRAYQPTTEQLSFDPDENDDLAIQTQYKQDYEFTEVEMRDAEGNLSGKKYYFWVKSKSVSVDAQTMSMIQATELLENGEDAFAIFARARGSADTPYFDSCAIFGLNSYVAKNNTFKLRFIRDFTLRDDPEELRLKNTHTEWTLIRKQQPQRIPKSLWDIITDAACGQDAGGNPLPSQIRKDYDERNGTRTRFGFKPGQIFADAGLVTLSLLNAIVNTPLTLKIGREETIDYITVLDFDKSNEWFASPASTRQTMDAIWAGARNEQINYLFFSVLEDALANNYEFSDIFKTSFIAISTTTQVEESGVAEQTDGIY